MEIIRAFARLQKMEAFERVVDAVEAVIASGIDEYQAQLGPPPGRDPGTKAVKDAVWGMVDLQWREVVVLDSPPLQRLRRIRQLGLGYLTYPTAGYSRFEHTLGATHQADRMVRAIARRSGRVLPQAGGGGSLEAEILGSLSVVRLAALMHDVGHLPLSHVSERYYSAAECGDTSLLRQVEQMRDAVQTALDVKRPSLAECLSVAVILTPSFKGLLTSRAGFAEAEILSAAGAIVGRPPSSRQAFVSQLITNVIDADKLDYMFRDGSVTGVPLAVDLERLLFKLKCLELPVAAMPDGLRNLQVDQASALVLGIDLAGQRLAYDVTLARTMLFERVYLHHKTRAAERVAMARLDELAISPWRLLAFGDELFTDSGSSAGRVRRDVPTSLIRERWLPRRAYTLSYAFLANAAVARPGEEPELAPEQTQAWRRLRGEIDKAGSRRRLEDKVLRLARAFARAIDPETSVDRVWIDTPPGSGDIGTWDLWVETPDGHLEQADTYDARAAAFAHSPAHAFFVYVTGSGRCALLGFIAAELVFAARFGMFVGRAAADYAKIRYEEIEAIKRELEGVDANVYAALGRLRPEPSYLRTSTGRKRVQELAERLSHYTGETKVRVDAMRVSQFLRQFPGALVEEMAGVLAELRFLDREDVGTGLAAYLNEGADENEVFVPLSRAPDKSATHLAYYLRDYAAGLRIVDLDEALGTPYPLTFYDDQLLSGSQARSTVQIWLGLEPELAAEEPDLARQLSEAEVQSLHDRRVRFRFAYGHADGLQELQKLLGQNGLSSDVAARAVEPRHRPLTELGVSTELRGFLQEVGEDLLLSTKGSENPVKWTRERCHKFALGYGGLEQLVALLYNTPTGTVTALWKGGRFGGSPWLPLLPRRNEAGVTRAPRAS